MKKFIYIIAILLPLTTIGQMNDAKYQEVVLKTLQLVNDYKSASILTDQRVSRFKNLFKSENSRVVNDIPIFNDYKNSITVDEYTKLVRKNFNRLNVTVDVEDILKLSPTSDNSGQISVLIKKTISCQPTPDKFKRSVVYSNGEKDEESIRFSDEFYEVLDIDYNSDYYKISEVRLFKEKGDLVVLTSSVKKGFASKAMLVEDIDFKIKVDGKEILQKGGHFIPINDLQLGWELTIDASESKNKDYLLTKKTYTSADITDNLVPVEFKQPIGFASAIGKFNLNTTTLTINTPDDAATLTNNSSNSFGASFDLDLYALEVLKNKIWILNGIYGRVEYLRHTYDHNINVSKYTYDISSIDPEGMPYIRTVDLTNIDENHQLIFSTLSAGVSAKFGVNNFDLLVSANYGIIQSQSGTYTSSAESINYTGFYNTLFDITIYDNYHDFGTVENVQGSGNLDLNENIDVWTLNFNAQISLNPRLVFFGGVGYTAFQGNIYNKSNDYVNVDFSDDGINNDLKSVNNLPIQTSLKYGSIQVGISYKL